MRLRLALMLVCGLVVFSVTAGPALADHNHRAKTAAVSTTSTTSTATTGKHAKGDKRAKDDKDKKKKHSSHHVTPVKGATAAQGQAVIRDCTSHGQLTQQFTRPELKEALAIMSASTSQYTNCSTVIHDALAHGIKPTQGGGSGGSSSTTTIVIIIVVVLVLLAAIFGGLALRRRRGGGGGDGDAPAQV